MPSESTTATSPASPPAEKKSDAKSQDKGPGNLTTGQAAAQLFANEAKPPAPQQPARQAVEEKAPEQSDEVQQEISAAEADSASAETTSEETANAADTSAPAETEDKGEADLSHKPSFTPEQQAIFDKRLGKEIGKRTVLEQRISELEAKISQIPAPAAEKQPEPAPVAPMPSNIPLADISDIPTLKRLDQTAKDAIRWGEDTLAEPKAWRLRVEKDPETGEPIIDPQTGEPLKTRVVRVGNQEYDEHGVRAIIRNARIAREDHIPAREEFLKIRAQAQNAAFQEFPFLKNKQSAEYQLVEGARRQYPELANRPDADWALGLLTLGAQTYQARRTAATEAAKEKPKPKLPAQKPGSDQSAVSSSASAARVPNETAARQALAADKAKASAKGGLTAAEASAFLQRSERLRNTR